MRSRVPVAYRPRSERAPAFAATGLTLLWHGVIVAWLSTVDSRVRDAAGSEAVTQSIDIVFVPRRDDATRAAAAAAAERAHGAALIPDSAFQGAASRPTPASASSAPTLMLAPPSSSDSDASGFERVVGEDDWSPPPSRRAAAPQKDFAQPRNPLASDALDVEPRLRVRMRPPPSVERWLKALAPAGYEADPCPEIARAIAGLAPDGAAGSRALLDDALRYEAKHCR